MEKKIAAFDARRNFGRILQEVLSRGDRYVVERHGEPVAAVVPLQVYEQWKRARQAFFARVRQASEQAQMSAQDAEMMAEEAVRVIRAASDP